VNTEVSEGATRQAQRAAAARLRPPVPPVVLGDPALATPYAGLATRVLAFAIDAAVCNGIALFFGVIVGLGLSLLHLPSDVNEILAAFGAFLWVLWSLGYFVFFWSTTGQTPGNRVMSITVVDVQARGRLKPRRALLRFVALWAGAAALLWGILIMLWDDRRRCFQDRVARTVVLYTPRRPQI
jgi:uncharacterized RDD family membrane protein YckC